MKAGLRYGPAELSVQPLKYYLMILLSTTLRMRQKLQATLLLSCLAAVQRDAEVHSEADLSRNYLQVACAPDQYIIA